MGSNKKAVEKNEWLDTHIISAAWRSMFLRTLSNFLGDPTLMVGLALRPQLPLGLPLSFNELDINYLGISKRLLVKGGLAFLTSTRSIEQLVVKNQWTTKYSFDLVISAMQVFYL